ncbi:MAG: hypothetical protein ABI488_19530 [Polyangiaceae bacterium]
MFHSIFVMGSGLAIGCGGVATVDPDHGSAGASAATPGGSDNAGGVSSLGGATSTAGTGAVLMIPYGGYGGDLSTGGSLGVSGAGGSAFIHPVSCLPAQWTCPTPLSCTGYEGDLALGTGCKCDLTRPTRQSDCAPGLILTCADATEDAAGNRLGAPTPYECSCIAATTTTTDGCNGACDNAYGAARFGCEFEVDSSILCHCPVVVVLK